jgi:hypothetical protein
VKRNVVELAELPTGHDGRASKSLTPKQVDAVPDRNSPHRMHNYIVLSLLTGARTEEPRAPQWRFCCVDASVMTSRHLFAYVDHLSRSKAPSIQLGEG